MPTIQKISPNPSLPKRGFIPLLEKERLGGFYKSMFSVNISKKQIHIIYISYNTCLKS